MSSVPVRRLTNPCRPTGRPITLTQNSLTSRPPGGRTAGLHSSRVAQARARRRAAASLRLQEFTRLARRAGTLHLSSGHVTTWTMSPQRLVRFLVLTFASPSKSSRLTQMDKWEYSFHLQVCRRNFGPKGNLKLPWLSTIRDRQGASDAGNPGLYPALSIESWAAACQWVARVTNGQKEDAASFFVGAILVKLSRSSESSVVVQ